MRGIIKNLLLKGELEALHRNFEAGGIIREGLVHGGASIDGNHNGVFGHR